MNKENHSACTVDTLNVFESIKGRAIANKEFKTLLAKFSEKEDGGFQRPFHWHFFNNGGNVGNSFLPGERTSEIRFADLVHTLEKHVEQYQEKPKDNSASEAEAVLEYTARIVHHIQDMGTPSHVVPVYHGLKLKDAYEVFCKSLFAVQRTFLVETQSSTPREDSCIELTVEDFNTFKAQVIDTNIKEVADVHLLQSLYTFCAHQTLSYLHKNTFTILENNSKTVKDWSAFWDENSENPDSRHAGFGNFGSLENNFGKATFSVGETTFEIDDRQYLCLIRDMYKQMVLGTLFVLDYINEQSSVFTQ